MTLCPTTRLICYATAAKAYATIGRASSRRRKYKPNGSAFRCQHCNQWHATSRERGSRTRESRNA